MFDQRVDVQFKPFLTLDSEEQKIILTYRNLLEVRKFMLNSDVILEKDHFKWIESLKSDNSSQHFAVLYDQEIIGSVNLTKINGDDQSANWGFYLGKKPIKGMGTLMLYIFLNKIFSEFKINKVIGEVLYDNDVSLAIHNKLGFSDNGVITHNQNKRLVQFILEKKDWLRNSKMKVEKLLLTYL